MAARRAWELDRRYRRVFRRERIFHDRSNPLDVFTDEELLVKYRFSREGILFLCNLLTDHISRSTSRSHAIPVVVQIVTALHYLACGSFQRVTGECIGISLSQASVSRIVSGFIGAIVKFKNQFIVFPTSNDKIRYNQQKFYSQHHIPNIVGLVDGTHVQIIAPHNNEDIYVNRLSYHSINTQVIVDYNSHIVNIVAKWPGSVHDSTVLSTSQVKLYFEGVRGNSAGILLGDSGYACTNWLLTPYRRPSNPQQERFNSAHKRCRAKVERAIGQLKRRWSCLHQELRVSPEKACKVIVACGILHNIAKRFNLPDVVVDGIQLDPNARVQYDGPQDTAMRDVVARNM